VQDAERIINESIDPHARVIFGAIKDDKLKKNEVKVTVIATGFPEVVSSSSGMRPTVLSTPYMERIEPREEETVRGRIFNSLAMPKKEDAPIVKEPVAVVAQKSDAKPVSVQEETEDDDWGAVPAFLRRSKLK
jgi:cell division GTPase FtsZ